MAKPRRRAADPVAASSTTDGPATAGTPWRGLDPYQRFALLSNHFRTSEALADATGLSVASIRQIFRATVLDGKRSPTLESDRYKQAMRRARHRMTDQTPVSHTQLTLPTTGSVFNSESAAPPN